MNLTTTITRMLWGLTPLQASFKKLQRQKQIYLYAGDLPRDPRYDRFTGLSLSRADRRHIWHDVTAMHPLPDGCVDSYQSEDVFEHSPNTSANCHR